MSIIVFGSINMDITAFTPRLPKLGETLFGTSYITVPGGKGNNQAVVAARLGAKVKFVGRVGKDIFGSEVLNIIKSENVDISAIKEDANNHTGLAIISVDEKADNGIIVISGANMAIDEQDVLRATNSLEDARVLMLQMEVPLNASLALARMAKEHGITIIFDPAPAPSSSLPDEFYQLVDIVTPNELETEALVGFPIRDMNDAEKASIQLRKKGVATAIIKLGDRGVYFNSQEESGFIPPFKVKAIDSVAAGDAFNGALAVAISEGKPIAEAVRWGAAAGALATTKKGALPSMPYRDEVLNLLSLQP